MKLLYTGKAKEVYEYDKDIILMKFTNNATAFNGKKHEQLDNKAIVNNKISLLIFNYLEKNGIKTHLIKKIDDTSQLCHQVDIIPLEVICRNIVAGSMSNNLGIEEGYVLESPVIETSYKKDELNDPLINDYHILVLKICTKEQLEYLYQQTLLINQLLITLFKNINLKLVDFKLEFGLDKNHNIILADEFSPDNCRLWDYDTNEKFDKDRFRRDLGDVISYYEEVFKRLEEYLHD